MGLISVNYINVIILIILSLICNVIADPECPSMCTCAKESTGSVYKIECYDPTRTITDGSIFTNIANTDYPDLDTVIVHGFNFSLMNVNQPLFGFENPHTSLTKLDISNNSLTELHQNLFQGMEMLQELTLDNNHLQRIDTNLLWKVPLLQKLSLNGAFIKNPELSGEERKEMLKNFFIVDDEIKKPSLWNNLTHLTDVDLRNNGLKSIDPKTFCHIVGMPTIDLSHNQLDSFSIENCNNDGITELDLSSNFLETIDEKTLNQLSAGSRFTNIGLTNNPWRCDCDLKPMIYWLKKNHDLITSHDQTELTCDSAVPDTYIGYKLMDMNPEIIECEHDSKLSRSILFSMCLIMLALLFLWFLKRNRHLINRKFQNGTANPQVINKYSKLVDSEVIDEAHAAFV